MRVLFPDHRNPGPRWRALGGLLLALVLALTLATPAIAADVTFRDPNLEAAVRTTLGVPAPQPVTDTDMLGLTLLVAPDQGITDLDGLEYATNLGFIALPGNEIRDVSSLSGLSQLVTVYLEDNQIKDISPLCSNPVIRDLKLNGNLVTYVPPIAWANPYFVQIRDNRIADLSGFAGYTARFESLDLSGNRINDLTPLASLRIASPESINLSNNRIKDLSPLIRPGEMTYFYLSVEYNYLNLTPGSTAMDQIATLTGKNAIVGYLPQKVKGHAGH